MYRTYENPYTLEDTLQDLQNKYELMRRAARIDSDELFKIHEQIEDLKERINHAWQDIDY